MIAAAALLALAGPAAAVCRGAPQPPAGAYLADDTLHRTLRAEIGVAMPTAPERIAIYAAGGHLQTTRISAIATRQPDGRWQVDMVERSKIWVDSARSTDAPQIVRLLSTYDGGKVDDLLGTSSFWHEAPASAESQGAPHYGLMTRTIDIVTPACTRRETFTDHPPALIEQLIERVTAR